MGTEEKKSEDSGGSKADELERLLEERARLDLLLEDEFTKFISVMFTDMKGSTALTEAKGDMAVRLLIKKHNSIVFPSIEKHNGILVKTMGDGTMSYFENAQDALRAGVDMQHSIFEHNKTDRTGPPIQIRVGIHSGKGIVEDTDIYGDVVNVASRFEQIATVGDVYFSEEAYNALSDKEEIYNRQIKTTMLKGKKEPVKVFKAFWNPEEVEEDKKNPTPIIHEGGQEDTAPPLAPTGNEPTLTVNIDGSTKEVTVLGNDFKIGRAKYNELILEKPFVSRKHARIFLEGGKYFVESLGSQLGITVNGKKVEKQELLNMDQIGIGEIKLSYSHTAPQEDDDAGATMVMTAFSDDDAGATVAMTSATGLKLIVWHEKDKLTEHHITDAGLSIGRHTDNDVHVNDSMASRKHARVWSEGGKAFIEDLGSNNGTVVSENKIEPKQKHELKENDEIGISSYKIEVVDALKKVEIPADSDKEENGHSPKSSIFGMFGK